jgi:hypothetical protein
MRLEPTRFLSCSWFQFDRRAERVMRGVRRRVKLDTKLKGFDYESFDTVCRMVYTIRALLAYCLVCAGSLSSRLAFVFAVAAYRHHA